MNILEDLQVKDKKHSGTAELPVVQSGKPKIFGKTKAQIAMVEMENQSLQQEMLKLRTATSIRSNNSRTSQGADAVMLFEQRLKGILANIQSRDRQTEKDRKETTLQLWK